MLRQENTRPLRWADKTLSMLKASQLEACEKSLASLPGSSLFDPDASDLDAENFFDASFYSSEEKHAVLHSIEGLRSMVMEAFPAELALLSREEHELVVRLAVNAGTVPLQSWEEIIPARGLVRRLWATVQGQGEGLRILMPRHLCLSALLLMSSDAHRKIRQIIDEFYDAVDDTLYLLGATPAAGPMSHLCSSLKNTEIGEQPRLVSRMLQVGFDYVIDRDRQMLLIHPGLAETDRLCRSSYAGLFSMGEDALSTALSSLEAIEDPLYLRLEALLDGSLRQDISVEDAAEDLILLAKQNVSYTDMCDVLSSLLITLPSPEMLEALRRVHDQTPRWLSLNASRVQ